jgi:S1-C subfamily serine protease
VVGRASEILLRLNDGRVVPAALAGSDPATDLALLKAELDLPVPESGARPGLAAPVCAIGNQFGLGLSVTCGVVSAVARSGVGFNPIEDFIQTDATVNPGASGGALVDGEGRLVGVLSAIFTKSSDADIGVNFAVSLEMTRRVVDDLIAHGRVIRARSGLLVEDLDGGARRTLTGARVTRVSAGSAAAEAGIQPGDVVTAVAGRAIARASDVTSAMQLQRPGDRVEVALRREAGAISVTLELTR